MLLFLFESMEGGKPAEYRERVPNATQQRISIREYCDFEFALLIYSAQKISSRELYFLSFVFRSIENFPAKYFVFFYWENGNERKKRKKRLCGVWFKT